MPVTVPSALAAETSLQVDRDEAPSPPSRPRVIAAAGAGALPSAIPVVAIDCDRAGPASAAPCASLWNLEGGYAGTPKPEMPESVLASEEVRLPESVLASEEVRSPSKPQAPAP